MIMIRFNKLNANVKKIPFIIKLNFDNVPKLKPSDFTETNDDKNDINLCFTHEKRKEINQIKMIGVFRKKSIERD